MNETLYFLCTKMYEFQSQKYTLCDIHKSCMCSEYRIHQLLCFESFLAIVIYSSTWFNKNKSYG